MTTFRCMTGLLAALGVGIAMMGTTLADSPRISRQNPYRTFNLSGRNYGSVRWERQHRGRSTDAPRQYHAYPRQSFRSPALIPYRGPASSWPTPFGIRRPALIFSPTLGW